MEWHGRRILVLHIHDQAMEKTKNEIPICIIQYVDVVVACGLYRRVLVLFSLLLVFLCTFSFNCTIFGQAFEEHNDSLLWRHEDRSEVEKATLQSLSACDELIGRME